MSSTRGGGGGGEGGGNGNAPPPPSPSHHPSDERSFIMHSYLDTEESSSIEERVRERRRLEAFKARYYHSIPCRNPAVGPTVSETMHYYHEKNRLIHDLRNVPRPTSHYTRANGDILDRPRDELDVRAAPIGHGAIAAGKIMDDAQMHAEAALRAARKQKMPDPEAPPPIPGASYDIVRADDDDEYVPPGRPPPVEEIKMYDPTADYDRPGNHYPGCPGVPPDWKPPTIAPANKAHWCASCGFQGTRFKCGQCRDTFYCSRSCQRNHWPEHKLLCSPAALNVDAEEEEAQIDAKLKRIGWDDDDD